MTGTFRFTFGPWNIHEGADPFGPAVRQSVAFDKKLSLYKDLGFDGIQLHDDDAVPGLSDLTSAQVTDRAKTLRKQLDGHGLTTEFVAPRLWEDPRTIDGGFTSHDPACRRYAIQRALRNVDVADTLGTNLVVVWFAREGTYLRESKDSVLAVHRLVEAVNAMLAHHPQIRIAIEPKPNEPMDHNFIPTIGHALGLAHICSDPARVGGVIESAHAILCGLDPSEEMGYALALGKLWSVHLNDQNGLKYDQDKSFGAVDLRRAFNQVRVLDRHGYGRNGEWVGLDVKAMRTQKDAGATKHLRNSRAVFLRLLDLSRSIPDAQVDALIADRDYEELDLLIMQTLLGK